MTEKLTQEQAEELVRQQLIYIGETPDREGLIDTPRRVVKMWNELFVGYDKSKKPNVTVFRNGADGLVYDQMIIDEGNYYSFCEHHIVPFFGQYWFGYIPDPHGNIIGLSKVARIVDYHSSKLQIQERLVNDVIEDIYAELCKGGVNRPIGMGMVMIGEHLCKTMRGAKKKGKMTTIKLKHAFLDNPVVKSEFLSRCSI